MLLSTQTEFFAEKHGYIEGVERLCKIGYDCLDLTLTHLGKADNDPLLTDNYREIALKIRETAESHGIRFNQCHAPYRFRDYDFLNNPDTAKDIFFKIRRAIEIAGIIGASQIVVHPWHHKNFQSGDREFFFNTNLKFYGELVETAKSAGVKIALENMWQKNIYTGKIVSDVCSNPHEFAHYIDELNALYGECFTACLDIGHCALVGVEPADAIKILGDRLGALHVHDNNCEEDEHLLALCGKIDYSRVITALKEINYGGELTFECDKYLKKFPKDHTTAIVQFMIMTGRFLISKFEN